MSSAMPKRGWGFACTVCRRRKAKCDGQKPCMLCQRAGEECVYRDGASVSTLHRELERANNRIRQLEARLAGPDRAREASQDVTSRGQDTPQGEDQEILADHGVDEAGNVQYFGETSRFHVGSGAQETSTERQKLLDEMRKANDENAKAIFQTNARFQTSWESLAYARLEHDRLVDPNTAMTLLNRYWTWQQPLHNWVYRRCFTRDMALGGPYFSQFLLNVIFAHASRHLDPEDRIYQEVGRGDIFLTRAKQLLQLEMEQPRPRIPTIQGLLMLGGRQCAIGNSSEGWLYTGMAIRMIKDIGLHLNVRRAKAEDLSPEDIEVRKRLYLSAYAWDKSISICLGRPPSLTDMPYSPDSLLDRSDNDEEWLPFALTDAETSYQPVKSHNTDTFISLCHLSQIINKMYDLIYNGSVRRPDIVAKVFALEEEMRTFHRKLPEYVRIDDVSSMQACPPPHILCLNILYHTTLILLYRPFLFGSVRSNSSDSLLSRARSVCFNETAIVNDFSKAHGRTFNFKLQTYLVSYCVYTAATVDAFLIKGTDKQSAAEAARRLVVTLKMLESEARQTPGMQRSIEIIKARLRTPAFSPLWNEGGNSPSVFRDTPPPVQARPNMAAIAQGTSPGTQQQYQPVQISSLPTPAGPTADLHGLESGLYQSTFASDSDSSSWAVGLDPFSPNEWLAAGTWNAGAGFVPDALNWSLQDTMTSYGMG